MRRRNTTQTRQLSKRQLCKKQLCNGPGKLAQAFGFSLEDNHQSVLQTPLYVLPANEPYEVAVSPRIGITKAADALLRFYLPASPFVSPSKWK